jgi:peptidoglycan/LPS O-acetylase OafA/YrhL
VRDVGSTRLHPAPDYIPGLDGMRAWAVLLVVAFHARVIPGGFVGVDVFFVLSAFLITRILQRELEQAGEIRLVRFYQRRLVRLGPALALFLLAYVTVAPLIWPGQPHFGDAVLALLYLSDYSFAFFGRPQYLQHTWSLAVEEQFYLIWPLLLPFLLRLRRPMVAMAMGYVAVLCWRASFDGDWASYYYRADTRCTGLIVGAALAVSINKLTLSVSHAWVGAGLIVCAALFGRFGPAASAVFPLAECGAAMLVGAAAQGRLGSMAPLLCAPTAILLGKLSYGIYLWHYPITVALRPFFSEATLFLLVLLPSVALAWLSFVTVERLPSTFRGSVRAPAH